MAKDQHFCVCFAEIRIPAFFLSFARRRPGIDTDNVINDSVVFQRPGHREKTHHICFLGLFFGLFIWHTGIDGMDVKKIRV
jgi:hypothetical protein